MSRWLRHGLRCTLWRGSAYSSTAVPGFAALAIARCRLWRNAAAAFAALAIAARLTARVNRDAIRGPAALRARNGYAQIRPHRHRNPQPVWPADVLDLSAYFPLLTTKKVHFKFGSLRAAVVFARRFQYRLAARARSHHLGREWASDTGVNFGPIYGVQWRSWPAPSGEHIDQISAALICCAPIPIPGASSRAG